MKQYQLAAKIANRFLMTSRVQSALIALGIAVGITTQIFVGSIIFSLQDSTIKQTIGNSAHISLQNPSKTEPIRLTKRIVDTVRKSPEVDETSLSAVRYSTALYTQDSDTTSLNLIGGRPADLNGIYNLGEKLIDGKQAELRELREGDIFLGKEFAKEQRMAIGDSLSLRTSNGGSLTFVVRGIYDLGAAAFNERNAFVSGDTVQSMLGWRPDEYSQINIQLTDPFASRTVAERWSQQLSQVKVTEWQSQNTSLLAALTSQSVSSYFIQGFVLVAIALGIASTLAIAAVQKTRQIGILKAMGMTDKQAGQIFFFQAFGLGLAGSTLGVVLSFGSLAAFSLAPVPFDLEVQPWFMVMSWLIGVVVAIISSLIPIRNTSRLDPIEVIQNG